MDPGPCFVYVSSKIDALNFEVGSLKSEVRSRKSLLGFRVTYLYCTNKIYAVLTLISWPLIIIRGNPNKMTQSKTNELPFSLAAMKISYYASCDTSHAPPPPPKKKKKNSGCESIDFWMLTPKSLLEGRCPRNPGAATAITTPRH